MDLSFVFKGFCFSKWRFANILGVKNRSPSGFEAVVSLHVLSRSLEFLWRAFFSVEWGVGCDESDFELEIIH